MVSPGLILLGFLLPAVIVGSALVFARRWPRLGPPAVGLGFLVGHYGVVGALPSFPPPGSTQMLFFLAAGAGMVGWFEGRGTARTQLGLLAPRVVVSALVPLLLLRNLLRHWEARAAFDTVGLAALALLVAWSGTDALAERRKGPSLAACLWLAATGASLSLMISGFALGAQFAGVVASMLGAVFVAAWIRPELSLARGLDTVVMLLLGALCVTGVHLAELPSLAGLLLVLAPLAAWLVELGPLAGLPPRRAAALRFAAVLIPVAIALYFAWDDRPPPDPYSDYR